MAEPLPIIADVPSSRPGLGFSEYAEALADAIRGGEPPRFTIGVYGPWGSGKSSLLEALAASLSAPSSLVVPVLFDAWRYERADHIIVPLLHRICEAAAAAGDQDLAKTLKRALGALVYSLKFSIAGVSVEPSGFKEAWDESGLVPLDAAFSQPFREMSQIPGALKGRRIAVLIDDLDRCSPDKVVAVLEAINLVMDVPGFIFVLALDYDVLIDAVSQRYPHVSGHAFIEKIVQLPFRVPHLDVAASGFLEQLIPHWNTLIRALPARLVACAPDVAVLGLRGNPRQIKRFLNSFLLIDRIIRERALSVDYESLAAVIALQLAWPDDHHRLQEAVFLGEADPLQTLRLRAEEDPLLHKFVARFLTAKLPLEDVWALLQLTAVVVASTDSMRPPALGGPADDIREQNRGRLIEVLLQHGFKPSTRSERLYYKEGAAGARFAFRKHYVNYERRVGDEWGLQKTFLLTRELDAAIAQIKSASRPRQPAVEPGAT